ncbi:MAG: hypothetical protein JO254_08980, partial [Pseudolabrys sp.]|nr:hypothetical protein [Pseudolabrys sp.]
MKTVIAILVSVVASGVFATSVSAQSRPEKVQEVIKALSDGLKAQGYSVKSRVGGKASKTKIGCHVECTLIPPQ